MHELQFGQMSDSIMQSLSRPDPVFGRTHFQASCESCNSPPIAFLLHYPRCPTRSSSPQRAYFRWVAHICFRCLQPYCPQRFVLSRTTFDLDLNDKKMLYMSVFISMHLTATGVKRGKHRGVVLPPPDMASRKDKPFFPPKTLASKPLLSIVTGFCACDADSLSYLATVRGRRGCDSGRTWTGTSHAGGTCAAFAVNSSKTMRGVVQSG